MNTNNFLFFFLLFCINAHAQVSFEKGYIIDNAGKRTDCWIKNVDWRQNPSEFEYRLTSDNPIQKGSLQNITEFAILNTPHKYVRAKVKIEVSPRATKELSKTKEPLFEEKNCFLKVLVDGKARLYEYNKSRIINYLFRVDNEPITTLIFKKYLLSTYSIAENTTYKKQLWDALKCQDITSKDLSRLKFKKKELISLFGKYHLCNGIEYTALKKKNTRESIKFAIKGGVGFSQADITFNGSSSQDFGLDFPNEASPRIGVEVEFIFPFNKNKWSFFVQPLFQSYTTDGTNLMPSQEVDFDYKSIETTLGIRHYSFLTDSSKLFFNAGIIIDAPINSRIDFENRVNAFEIETQSAFNLGLGYTFKDSYSIEVNYTASRQLLTNFATISSTYTNFSLILGYRIF
ncbi:hypothetical protein [Spongiimicrobium salis]|uniref:hypothetical protein n=1 Tax=Spongiimicrobium salis TaxID=1667022 RepID=UPI00374DE89B